jgi:putative ABC transport system permease protein
VLWMVMRDVASMLAVGLACGIAFSLALTRLIAAQLYGVEATDIWTYVVAMAVLGAVALLSGFLPARRASAIDPLATLRYE